MSNEHNKDDSPIVNPHSAIRDLHWCDEILQVMYWMTGEGLGQEVSAADLQRLLAAEDEVLVENLERMVSGGLLERVGDDKFALTDTGRQEGGRRFADEFETMLKPGHFECSEPDCDCHNPESSEGACKHFAPAH